MAAISVRAVSKDDLKKRTTVTPIAPTPAPAPAPIDPMRGTIEAIDQLVKVITAQQTNRPALSDFPTLPPEAKPVRLEAEVIRDDKGKMKRVVITPVY